MMAGAVQIIVFSTHTEASRVPQANLVNVLENKLPRLTKVSNGTMISHVTLLCPNCLFLRCRVIFLLHSCIMVHIFD